jgi:hypothetical protein
MNADEEGEDGELKAAMGWDVVGFEERGHPPGWVVKTFEAWAKEQRRDLQRGTQFTPFSCFPGAAVQILTQ